MEAGRSETVAPRSFLHLAPEALETFDRERLLRLAKTFIRVEGIIDSVYDLNRLLELVMRESTRAVRAETSSLLLYDADTNELYFEVALEPAGDQIQQIRLPMDETSIAGWAAVHRVPLNIKDAASDPRWNKNFDQQTQFVTRNLLAIPMLRQDRLIGIIEVLNKIDGDCFTDDDIDILMILGGLAAIAIENAHLYQKNMQAERLAVLGQAVANISHYIKNVLTGLKGSITLIESAVEDEEYEILKKATLVMKRSYGRIATLVKDMLSYSKGRDPSPVETDPNRIVSEVRDLMIDSANAKEIELVTRLDPQIPIVLVDPEILEGVLLNLITNGMDAVYEWRQVNPDVQGRIVISTSYANDLLTVRVSDNGPGIPKKDQNRIFVAFYTTKGSSGTGLGLAVSKKLVEENGGSLLLYSEEGRGTTFELNFPAPRVDSRPNST